MRLDGVVLLHTPSAALRAGKIYRRAQMASRSPSRELSSDCNPALRFAGMQLERLKTLLDAGRVEMARNHSAIHARGAVT